MTVEEELRRIKLDRANTGLVLVEMLDCLNHLRSITRTLVKLSGPEFSEGGGALLRENVRKSSDALDTKFDQLVENMSRLIRDRS